VRRGAPHLPDKIRPSSESLCGKLKALFSTIEYAGDFPIAYDDPLVEVCFLQVRPHPVIRLDFLVK
jgi:hypothetical protein